MLDLDERHDTTAGQVATGRFGSGPPLVLAHGWPWSSEAWHRVVPAFARHFRVHVYDMPGYGRSDMRADADTGLAAQGGVFTATLVLWGPNRPAVVAHDFGGAVSLRAHLLHRHKFDRLVLMRVGTLGPRGSAVFDDEAAHCDAVIHRSDHIHRAVSEARLRGARADPITRDDLAALLEPRLRRAGRVPAHRLFTQAVAAFTAELDPRLGQIRCPGSVFRGENALRIPLACRATRADRSGVRRRPGVGHLPRRGTPNPVAGALRTALAAEAA